MRNNKLRSGIIVVSVIVVLGILFYLPRIGKESIVTDVSCTNPNLPLTQHLHPVLRITVDGKDEIIPANIGLNGSCEHAIHTHDDSGTIHVESQDSRQYTLGDFFSVWGKSIAREGYTVTMTVDGKPNTDTGGLILQDKQQIILEYKKQ